MIKSQISIQNVSSPREAAYLSVLASLRKERFIEDSLSLWREEAQPSSADLHLALCIANGTMQMALALDYLATQLTAKKKLNLKTKEKVLLQLSLYQYYFLDRIPLYAIADEGVKLAHKYCHSTFVHFLNAALRRLEKETPILPYADSTASFSIKYSYPEFFVRELCRHYRFEQAQKILIAGNRPPQVMLRLRSKEIPKHWSIEIVREDLPVASLKDLQQLTEIANSSQCYIQNITPAALIARLAQGYPGVPQRILDLCASPGGKLLAAHDAFPHAALYANDVSPEKIDRLAENCQKYELQAFLRCGSGETYPSETLFDIIILDVPCTNSGVLNKRPEARWRLSQEAVNELKSIQLKLIEHALSLLSPKGELWFLTCSILPQENEELVEYVCSKYELKARFQELILPSEEGWDGGFACALSYRQ